MKIGIDDNMLTQVLNDPKKGTGTSGMSTFGSILDETIEKFQNRGTGPGLPGGSVVGGVSSVQFPTLGPGLTVSLADRVDRMLDTLDTYRQMLGDGRYSLRDMDPTVRQIAAEAESLQPELDHIPVEDELGDILNQTLIAASLEVIKFNRGDYVAA